MIDITDLNISLQSVGAKARAAADAALGDYNYTQAGTFTAIKNNLACYACNPTCWTTVFPHLTKCSGELKVCDAESYKRCGASCTWTVPAGASYAKFEVWGPGSSSGAGQCCGGSPFGATGAYATTVIPVTPGNQYVMCGGCAFCSEIYCTYDCAVQGSPSFVTGPGLTNFCAQGGCLNIIRRMCQQRTLVCGSSMCCRWQSPTCTSSGGCLCNSSFWCFSNSCASCGCIATFADKEVTFYGTPFGHNSIHAASCFNTDWYGFETHPPLVSPIDGKSQVGCCCFIHNNGNTCNACYWKACCLTAPDGQPTMTWPGMGGHANIAFGGCTGLYGDWGRMGMAKVSWC